MSIKIVLPGGEAPAGKLANGTRILTEDGHEIKGVQRCIIDIAPNNVITAHLSVTVRDIENLEHIAAHVHIDGVFPEDDSSHEQTIDRINQLRPGDS